MRFFSVVIVAVMAFNMFSYSKEIKWVKNPDLQIIREGWRGNVTINDKFHNDTDAQKAPMWNVVKWQLSKNPQKKEKKGDPFQLRVVPLNGIDKTQDNIVWLGHASLLITVNGTTFLTDPILENLPSISRKAPLPCPAESITGVDYLLLSHDHRDHFDKNSIKIVIKNNPNIEALIPLNAGRLLEENLKRQEAGWYQEYLVKPGIRVIFLPAKHWGRRGLNDHNKTLWGGFMIVTDSLKIYFAGDTAFDGALFAEINQLFGSIDFCILPIGAYSPAYMMQSAHTNPEEAFEAFRFLGGKHLIPMHYGTFDLSDEPLGEPIIRLEKVAMECDMSDKILKLDVGQVLQLADNKAIDYFE